MKPWEKYQQATAPAQAGPWQKYQQPEYSGVRNFGEGANVGIAQTFGAPVDLVNKGLSYIGLGSDTPVGGSQWLQNRMEDVNIPASEVRGAAGQVGQVVGASTAALPAIVGPFLRGATSVQMGAQAPATSLVRGIGESAAGTALRNPGRFMAAETGLATAAGFGGVAAENAMPDVPNARTYGELAGGLAPAGLVGLTSAATRVMPGVNAGRNIVSSLTPGGGRRRAVDRLRGTFDDPENVTTWRPDVLEEARLTPAQATESPRTLSLERSVMDATDELRTARDGQLRDLNETVNKAFTLSPDSTDATTQYLRNTIEQRINNAVQRARQAADDVAPNASREASNRSARKELDEALNAARQYEASLYNAVDQSAPVGTDNVETVLRRFIQDTAQAQQKHISDTARKYLSPQLADGEPNPNFLGDVTNIKQIRGLQSELRFEARQARAEGNYNKARMADDMADAITDDIAASSEDAAIRAATDFSRNMHQRFTQGEVGDLLGYSKTGEVKAPEGLTLERTVGRSGANAREGYDAIDDAVRFADEVAGTQRSAAVNQHVDQYILDSFNRAAVRNGELQPNLAQTFLRNNAEVLSRRPDLARRLQQAAEAGQAAIDTKRMFDPSESAAGVFLKAPPGSEIDRILRLPQPGKEMEELVNLANTDRTGKALSGLKQAFMDRLAGKARSNAVDAADRTYLSGQRMTDELGKPGTQQAARALFSPTEMERIEKIRRTAVILDKARSARPSEEGVVSDAAGYITTALGRILGARAGGLVPHFGGGGDIQTPAITSNLAQRLLKAGVNDPARRLINDAIQDEKLFNALLTEIQSPVQARLVQQRINAWGAEVLREYGLGAENEQE